MKDRCKKIFFALLIILAFGGLIQGCQKKAYITVSDQKDTVILGAYYFDGWTGKTQHVTDALKDSFPDRKPVWGWITSTPEIVNEQIELAADAGISFFSFCWYYSEKKDPLNHALELYLSAPNKKKLQFSLLVANHEGYIIGPNEWPLAIKAWVELFKDNSYLRVNGLPYISFFSAKTLVKSFGSTDAVKAAIDELKSLAIRQGLPGVMVSVCTAPGANKTAEAIACGFDVLTSYNDHEAGFENNRLSIPIDSLIASTEKRWNQFKNASVPYIPTVTLNWDLRPWEGLDKTPYYTGYSEASVFRSVRSVSEWLSKNPRMTPGVPIAILYAWNEYGEGAWLTPSEKLKDSLLQGLKKALKK
jgi:hypothetical protein